MAKALMVPEQLLQLDLSGKTAVVTGANSGIGRVTAEQLAKQGAHVVIACRRTGAGDQAAKEIKQQNVSSRIEVMPLDLGSLDSVRAFAESFVQSHQELHFLVNNAGVMNTPQGKTTDGYEMQFGTNHLGHFLLTELLLDTLKKSAPARIVNLSSCFHDKAMGRDGEILFDDLQFSQGKYDGWKAYAQSKLANLLHAKELAERLEGSDVTAVSVHPGWVRTNLVQHSMPLWVQNALLKPILRMKGMIEPWEGAQTSLYAVLSPEIPAQAGEFFSQTGMYRDKSKNAGGWPLESPNPNAHDMGQARRLREVSLELVGQPPMAGTGV